MHSIRAHPYNSMFLVRVGNDDVLIGRAIHVTYQTIALVDGLLASATVPRQRHPSAIGYDPAFLALVSDDGREHAERDVVDLANTEPSHHQIEEDEHARADFRHSSEVRRVMGRWCRADADDRARQPRLPQNARGLHDGQSFRVRVEPQRLDASALVAVAGMGEYATQLGTCRQRLPYFHQLRQISGSHTGAVAVAIDLDHGRDARSALPRRLGYRLCLLNSIQSDYEIDAARPQFRDTRELRWGDADRID